MKAVKGITGKQPSELKDDGENNFENLKGTKESLESLKKPKVKQSRKRKNDGDTLGKAMSKRKTTTDGASSSSVISGEENLLGVAKRAEPAGPVRQTRQKRRVGLGF
ncbi:hypothetical protein PIB30_053856 [Stylosanthes scabra]|uniref:Uncharacterized protein n=1 Tax=Stylosanthes scabra TaxID=79078 RepID=A0ABU6XJT1_9FABA|nr:hypothetical protein [Stylosanthes scabra]